MSTKRDLLEVLADEYIEQMRYNLNARAFGSWLMVRKQRQWVEDNEITFGELQDALGNKPGVDSIFVERNRIVGTLTQK